MKNIKCLIFDFGNVIAFFDHRKACRQLAKISSNHFDGNEIYEEVFKPGGLEEKYDRGVISTDEFISQLRNRFQITAIVEKIENAWSDIFWPNKDVIDLIPVLEKMSYGLVLASNTNELHYKWFSVKYSYVLRHFHSKVLSHIEKCRKPDTEFYWKCVEKSKCHVSQCVFVDDREDYVGGARDLGMKGIHYTPVTDLELELRKLGVVIR
jgi:putative hydrolase of the HAD superfamily